MSLEELDRQIQDIISQHESEITSEKSPLMFSEEPKNKLEISSGPIVDSIVEKSHNDEIVVTKNSLSLEEFSLEGFHEPFRTDFFSE
jgi:hypothetical protein